MTHHVIEPTLETCTDFFAAATPPVLRVESGDSMTVRTLDANGYLERQESPGEYRPILLESERGHCLVGPIEVSGARPGQVLAVRLDSLTPDSWGYTNAGKGDTHLNHRLGVAGESTSLLWEVDAAARRARNQLGFSVATAPFLGVIGLPPGPDGEHSTIPPRTMGGGNIDCKELVAGSTLFLPVTVPGALLSIGDGHAAQGDGEVSGTAIECGMTTELSLTLLDAAPVDGIHAETPAGRITFGFNADLNEALADALSAMVTWMQQLYSINRPEALALASVAVDMRVTQVANQTWGVHAVLAEAALERD